MLSYRHAFHAGNHADVLKHFILQQTLVYFRHKNKPFYYFDTHAGAGMYALNKGFAEKNQEYLDGIGRLLVANTTDLSPELRDFLNFIRSLTSEKHYSGSPFLAANLLGDEDRMRLFELHQADFAILQNVMRPFARGRRLKIEKTDGFAALIANLPPNPRRAVVLIDPPYEQKSDYRTAENTLREALKRFATGCYLIWYPCLQRPEAANFPDRLKKVCVNVPFLQAELLVSAPKIDGFGMFGSGMFIVNPPYVLQEILARNLLILKKLLGKDQKSHFRLLAKNE